MQFHKFRILKFNSSAVDSKFGMDFKSPRSLRRERDRLRKQQKRQRETPTSRKKRQESDYERRRRRLVSESPTSREQRLQKDRQRKISTREAESPTSRAVRLEKNSARRILSLSGESPTSREQRMQQERQRQISIREAVSPTSRAVRLEKSTSRRISYLSGQSPTSRKRRLEFDCQRQQQNRGAKTNGAAVFNRKIFNFADRVCDICHQLFYIQQTSNWQVNIDGCEYFPAELTQKNILLLCKRCKSHVQKRNHHMPPQISALSDVEVRLVSRIVPFLKIIKVKYLPLSNLYYRLTTIFCFQI